MRNLNKYYVNVDVLQVAPPSCMNRDDTGSPKTCTYGGVPRARVSSQCWKRASRMEFMDQYKAEACGVRTVKTSRMIADALMELDPSRTSDDALKLACLALDAIGIKLSTKKPDCVAAIMFVSQAQTQAIAKILHENKADLDAAMAQKESDVKAVLKDYKDELKAALKDNPSVDMSLFGRMVAASADLNVDACVQVGHAVSTHASHVEYDYFTAVDDMNRDDESGAGHVNVSEFNSSVLYRYACIDVPHLADQVGEDTPAVVAAFIGSFLTSMPRGRANAFGNFTVPDYVRIRVRRDMPVSMAAAFEKAVKEDGGYMDGSIRALEDYAGDIDRKYGDGGGQVWTFADKNLDEILSELEADVAAYCAGRKF